MSETTGSRSTTIKWVYLIIALFVALFLCLALIFLLQMNASVAIRAFVGAEGLWAKAQKDAIHSLHNYAASRDEADYLEFHRQIHVPLGDQRARVEMQKENPDIAVVREGLLQGRNHPVDIEYMIPFFRHFQHTAYLSKVIEHWTAGDSMIAELNWVGEALHDEIASGRNNLEAIRTHLTRLEDINRRVTVEQDLFSSTLTEASRRANDASRTFTYVVVLLSVVLGVGLSRPIITRIRRTENTLGEARDELVRKEKLAILGQVAGSVGHELRNPLGVMSNAVYFLQTVLSDADETIREYLNIIKDEISISERIISDLLDSVRTRPPRPEVVGLRDVVERTLRQVTIPSTVSVKLDIPETLPALRVDAMQITQVFRNLVSNGLEAMHEGGVLEIRAADNRPKDGTVRVSVRDSGSGMTPEQLGKLFQPLITTKARGIGLGLVVVKNLTEANGGSVEVQSAPGKGSTFTVVLPMGSGVLEM